MRNRVGSFCFYQKGLVERGFLSILAHRFRKGGCQTSLFYPFPKTAPKRAFRRFDLFSIRIVKARPLFSAENFSCFSMFPQKTATFIACAFALVSFDLANAVPEEEAEGPVLSEKTPQILLDSVRPMEDIDAGATPMSSTPDGFTGIFHIPAPRGLILTRDGYPLAVSYTAQRANVRLQEVATSEEEAIAAVTKITEALSAVSSLKSVNEQKIRNHFTNRNWLPFPLSSELTPDDIALIGDKSLAGVSLETIYLRKYPQGELFGHLTGYIGDTMPDQHGPIGEVEFIWPPSVGRSGVEKSLDTELVGSPGEVSRLYDKNGRVINQEIIKAPTPGLTVVTTISHRMQTLAEERLRRSGRPGAFVAVDADTGEILAMASTPSYDPNEFLGGISQERFREIADDPDAPLYDRALMGQYPPGSTFKPFVALAGMDAGTVDGKDTRYEGFPEMNIKGKKFVNWHKKPEPEMDVRYALLRSNNSWFYQAGMEMGSNALIDGVLRFGFGEKPPLPLPAVSGGNIPSTAVVDDDRAIANTSIGQGDVLSSPLQLALAMAGLSRGDAVPAPRIVQKMLDPISQEIVYEPTPEPWKSLYLEQEDLQLIHAGMWGVVNHASGTARGASMYRPRVYAKTGTSQWADDGKELSLAWFAGWADAKEPRIAFAALSLGRPGEMLSGGSNAAPIASAFLNKVYGNPNTYAVTKPSQRLTPDPDMKGMIGNGQTYAASSSRTSTSVKKKTTTTKKSTAKPITVTRRPTSNPVRTFFKKLFGR